MGRPPGETYPTDSPASCAWERPPPAEPQRTPHERPNQSEPAHRFERAHAGDRVPHRARRGADAHDVCDMERSGHRAPVADGNRLELRQHVQVAGFTPKMT